MKLFTDPLKGLLTMLLCGAFFMGEIQLFAAIAPLSQKQLDEQSELIVSGQVVAVESKVQKSKIERGLGIHRDRIYSIKLELVNFHKIPPFEQDLRFKEFIVVEAWRPATRIPPLPGPQGHESIPKKGDEVKMYLKWNKATALWQPLLPNGIKVVKKEQ
tara:strand:- start:46 stop:522 length:477 start_codon:yes stop_codon:yes gene_type:complete